MSTENGRNAKPLDPAPLAGVVKQAEQLAGGDNEQLDPAPLVGAVKQAGQLTGRHLTHSGPLAVQPPSPLGQAEWGRKAPQDHPLAVQPPSPLGQAEWGREAKGRSITGTVLLSAHGHPAWRSLRKHGALAFAIAVLLAAPAASAEYEPGTPSTWLFDTGAASAEPMPATKLTPKS